MAIQVDRLLSWPFKEVRHAYTERDTILYALSSGFGTEPTDSRQLPYVFERGLRALPCMALILGRPDPWYADPDAGITWSHLVHGEQAFTIHRPLPSAGVVLARERIKAVIDKGEGKGALVYLERSIHDAAGNALLATLESTVFCRADGGFGGPSGPVPPKVELPSRPPDAEQRIATSRNAALLYRLNGDTNPLHADPAFAAKAGFDRPILHGLCTMALAARALIASECDEDAARLHAMSVRFSAPFFPGETLAVDIWRVDGQILFSARCLERNVKVLDGGRASLLN